MVMTNLSASVLLLSVGVVSVCLLLAACSDSTGPRPGEASSPGAPAVRLRGFGDLRLDQHEQVRRDDGGSWTTFAAEDAGHAAITAAKYLADATAVGPVRVVPAADLPGTVLRLDPGGWWVLAVDGPRVHVVFAPTREALAARCAAAGTSAWTPVDPARHLRWLDCFDNAAVGFWFYGGGVLPKDPEADMRWFADNRFTMCVTGTTETRLVAPGVLDTTVLDWYAAKAKQYDVPYRMLVDWASPGRARFIRNLVPLPHIPDPDAPLVSAGAPGMDVQARAMETAWEPIAATDPWMHDARRRIAAHAAQDPRFMGHHVSSELGGCSLLGLERVTGLPETRRAWQAYLRDGLKLDLASASQRHTGRPDAWRSWDEVPVPRVRDFVGGEPAAAIELRSGGWEGKADRGKAGDAAGWFDPARDPGGWVPLDANDALIMQHGRDHGPGEPVYWLRRTVELPAGRLATPQFLHVSRNWWHGPHSRLRAWLNGRPLADLTDYNPVAADNAMCFALGDSAVAGSNVLVLDVRAEPIPSFIFIAPVGRQVYPDLGEPLNRRWFDALEFAARLRAEGMEASMRATRQGDATRPMKVMAPGNHYDALVELFGRYGAYPHDTGQAGACWAPWTTSAILARGGQHSSEPGSPGESVEALRQMMAFYLMLGDDAVDIVFHNDLYRTKPELAQWLAANRQLLDCIGKARRETPQVAVLRSNRATRLGFGAPYNWDITRGELQACGRTGQIVDLPDVAAGFVDAFPVLFDAGTAVLTEADIDTIEGYVRRGGTFVALHNTGMHSIERANAWPISRLTGLKPKQDAPIGGKNIRFSDTQDLCPGMRGRDVQGWGLVLDWMKRDVTGASLSLEPTDGAVEAIASWQDGLGVAIGCRRLGKGRVFTLGSTWWRDSRDYDRAFRNDPGKRPQLDQLLTALGVPRASTTPAPEVWAEQWRSKNGIFDIYPVAMLRTQPDTAVTGDITLLRAAAPAAIWEVSKPGSPAMATRWADGRLVLPGITAEPMLPRVFAAPRADLRLAALHWLQTQREQWSRLEAVEPVAAPPPAPAAEVLPLVDGWRASDGATVEGWQQDAPPTWKPVQLGSFAAMGFPEDARVAAVRRIVLPTEWNGRRVRLVFDAYTWFFGLNPHARLWLDGKPLAPPGGNEAVFRPQPDSSFNLDVTEQARDGVLLLALEIDGRAAAKPGWSPGRPAGVTGVFYLRPEDAPLATQPLDAWQAASDVNVLSPAPSGMTATYNVLETRFTLPASWPGRRLFLRTPATGLNTLILNNRPIVVTRESDRLDITGLVRRDGDNVLRWIPDGSFGGWPNLPNQGKPATRTVPALELAWWP